jgi:predicted nucleic-acid-binding protein
MTAVDTNVLVRILTKDDANQAALAAGFMQRQDRVYVLKTVLLETEWVLRSSYGFDREAVVAGFHELLTASNLEMEDRNAVIQALGWVEQGMDFADALHLASVSSETEFATFDASLRRTAGRLGIGRVVTI